MENNEPSKRVNKLYKRYRTWVESTSQDGKIFPSNEDWKEKEEITKAVFDAATIPGAVEYMDRNTILKLIAMQASLRFLPEHVFYMLFSDACKKVA